MRLRLREKFNIVVNGLARDFGGKDQSKTQTQAQAHSVNGPSFYRDTQIELRKL